MDEFGAIFDSWAQGFERGAEWTQSIFETISVSFDLFDEAAAFPDNNDLMSVPDLSVPVSPEITYPDTTNFTIYDEYGNPMTGHWVTQDEGDTSSMYAPNYNYWFKYKGNGKVSY